MCGFKVEFNTKLISQINFLSVTMFAQSPFARERNSLGPNPLIGIIFHWIGGFASATNFIPFRGIKRWNWEIYWIIQGIAAWLIAPIVLAYALIPHLGQILHEAPSSSIFYAVLWGVLWGVGGLTFGLSIRYLGIALGYGIALGLCTAFGTLIPPIYYGQMGAIARSRSGQTILLGVAVCLFAVVVNSIAGRLKEKEVTPEEAIELGERDYSLGKGLAVAIFAGVMSSFFAFGLSAGAPIAHIAGQTLIASGRTDLLRNLPVLVVVLWGGFFTNFVWSAILIVRNRSGRQFLGQPGLNPMRGSSVSGDTLMDVDPTSIEGLPNIAPSTLVANYFFAALAGVVWYFQFFFYSLGETKMGKYGFSSWTMHMASIIIFATLWGVVLKEWKGTSRKTKLVVAAGLFMLISSTLMVGYGNYLKAQEDAAQVVSNR
jgi:L-rhamnose-H+ transport protein